MATSIASIVSIHSEWKVNLNLARVYVKIMTLFMCFRHIKIIKYSQEKKSMKIRLVTQAYKASLLEKYTHVIKVPKNNSHQK